MSDLAKSVIAWVIVGLFAGWLANIANGGGGLLFWVIAGLIVIGLAAAMTGWRWVGYAWIGLFVCMLLVGLVDFYMWGYDYGHNLNPKAAIRIPGMAYQPPLIGSKKLLNFTAHSWPAVGGWAAMVSLVVGTLAMFFDRKRSRDAK